MKLCDISSEGSGPYSFDLVIHMNLFALWPTPPNQNFVLSYNYNIASDIKIYWLP